VSIDYIHSLSTSLLLLDRHCLYFIT